jgi:periplasmic divalent cation tolerance protein
VPGNDKPPLRDSREHAGPPAVGVVMIYATFPDREIAMATARHLVEKGLAAAVNVWPSGMSVFVWQGVMQVADETILIAKLAAEGADRAVAHIVAAHPYETPGVLVIPATGGHADYLSWIVTNTRTPTGQ